MYYFNQILTALNTLKMMSEVVLLQPNSNALNTLTIISEVYDFNQILNALNTLKSMSEVVLLQPYSNRLEHLEDYVRGCITSTKF
jgi:abortive infection bacteriophage resistance protein